MIFSSPFFLYFLPIVFTPVIIHLLFKRRLRVVKYTNVPFLNDLIKHAQKTTKLRDIILMIIRCLILLTLLLSLAGPILHYTPQASLSHTQPLVLIDASYSMLYHQHYQALFHRAKEITLDLYSLFLTKPQIIFFSNDVEKIIPIVSDEELKRRIEKIEPTYKTTNLYNTLTTLLSSDKKYTDIIIISDFAKYTFPDLTSVKIPISNDKYRFLLIKLGKEIDNAYIKSLDIKTPGYLKAEVVNQADESKEIQISTKLHEDIIDIQKLKIKPNHMEIYELIGNERLQNIQHGSLKLQDDNLLVDNEYFFSIPGPEISDITIIDEDKNIPGPFSGSYFIKKVLPEPKVKIITPDELEKTLKDLTVIAKMCSLSPHVLNNKLLIFLDENIKIEEYNNLLGIKIKELKTEKRNVEWLSTKHPIMKEISAEEFEWKKISVKKYFLLDPTGWEVIARLDNGVPFICVKDKRIIINSSPAMDMSNFSIKPIFPLFVRSSINFLAKKDDAEYNSNLLLGEPFKIKGKFDKVEIINPFGDCEVHYGSEVKYLNTNFPGIYKLKIWQRDKFKDRYFVVNVDRKESDLSKIDLKIFEDLFPKSVIEELSDGPKLIERIKTILYGKDLSHYFVICFLTFIGLEIILANPIVKTVKELIRKKWHL